MYTLNTEHASANKIIILYNNMYRLVYIFRESKIVWREGEGETGERW